ncbi:MAG: glycoside hydrolase family 25 protein [Candidatus Eremiobacteraeota bacterium]|nr:glycoside hydrolase family 25 protein [Candidatus Eremiobacteraeota bacterium]
MTDAPGLIRGIDVSFAQGDAIDWDSVEAQGLARFVYARASYGTYVDDDDPNFRRNHDECKRIGIPFGAYHFFLCGQSGAAQAQHFLQRIDGYQGQLRAMVDVEENSGAGDRMIDNLASFTDAMERALGSRVIVYTNQHTWNTKFGGTDAFAGHQLWVSNFTENPAVAPAMPAGFTDWTLYQYSSSGTLPLLDGSTTNVDVDVLKGDVSAIRYGSR